MGPPPKEARTMQLSSAHARLAIGCAVVAAAGCGVVVPLGALASAPPTSDPVASEPSTESVPADTGLAPALDPDRQAIVDQIATQAADDGFPMDRDCLARTVAQLPDADVPIVASQLDDPPPSTARAVTVGASEQGSATNVAEPTIPESTMAPAESTREPSAETEALVPQMMTCLIGDADPALVAEAMALLAADDEGDEFDMACMKSVLSTFDDDELELIIAEGVDRIADRDTAGGGTASTEPMSSAAEAVMREYTVPLLACIADLGDHGSPVETTED